MESILFYSCIVGFFGLLLVYFCSAILQVSLTMYKGVKPALFYFSADCWRWWLSKKLWTNWVLLLFYQVSMFLFAFSNHLLTISGCVCVAWEEKSHAALHVLLLKYTENHLELIFSYLNPVIFCNYLLHQQKKPNLAESAGPRFKKDGVLGNAQRKQDGLSDCLLVWSVNEFFRRVNLFIFHASYKRCFGNIDV